MASRRNVISLVFACFLSAQVGCDYEQEREVRAAFEALEAAYDNRRGDEAAALIASNYYQEIERLLDHARTSGPDEIEALSASNRYDIGMMRLMCTQDELKSLDGPGWVKLSTDRGWNANEEGWKIEIGKIRGSSTAAYGQIIVDRHLTDLEVDFVLEDGVWKIDYYNFDRALSDLAREWARAWQTTDAEVVFIWLQDDFDKLIPEDIWEAPKEPVKFEFEFPPRGG